MVRRALVAASAGVVATTLLYLRRRWKSSVVVTDATQLLEQNDGFIFDCDGVLWTGDVPIPGAVEAIAALQRAGKIVAFMTNNSSKSRRTYLAKFKKLGFTGVTEEMIYSSGYATAVHLKKTRFAGRILVLGSDTTKTR